eukprot:363171-Chlamydomonas_euryale.AAC.1
MVAQCAIGAVAQPAPGEATRSPAPWSIAWRRISAADSGGPLEGRRGIGGSGAALGAGDAERRGRRSGSPGIDGDGTLAPVKTGAPAPEALPGSSTCTCADGDGRNGMAMGGTGWRWEGQDGDKRDGMAMGGTGWRWE